MAVTDLKDWLVERWLATQASLLASGKVRTEIVRIKSTGIAYRPDVRGDVRGGSHYNFGGGWRRSAWKALQAAQRSGALTEMSITADGRAWPI